MKNSIFTGIITVLFVPLLCKVNNQRLSSFPYITGDSFRAIADHIYDETTRSLNPRTVKKGDVIFLKTDYMQEFFNQIHPQIPHKYILITHNSDYGAPGNFSLYLDDEKLALWFGMSPTVHAHPKFVPIPIGIANEYWPHGNTDTFNHLLKTKKTAQEKPFLVGINFVISTNLQERTRAFNYFSRQRFCTNIGSSNHAEYLAKMAQTKFVVSPPGNSLDCHRTWEILLAGSYPIVLSSNLNPLFQNLPVLIVTKWEEITESLLHEKFSEFQRRLFSNEKSLFLYWHTLIEFYKIQIRSGKPIENLLIENPIKRYVELASTLKIHQEEKL